MGIDSMPFRALCTGLPSPEIGNESKSLLLVLLADFDEPHKAELIQHLQPSRSKFRTLIWKPNHEVLQSLAPQHQHRDSQANLYGLAVVAHRAGHSGFIVADELTKRRVEGQFPIRGEDDRISVTMVSVRPGKRDGEVRVIAKRLSMGSDEDIDLFAAVQDFNIKKDFSDGLTRNSVPRVYSDLGFEFRDPDSPVFTSSTTDSLGYEAISNEVMAALSANIPLPPELVLNVTRRADKNPWGPINSPGWDLGPRDASLTIHLGFKTTEDEFGKLRCLIQNAVHVEFQKKEEERKKENEKAKAIANKNEDHDIRSDSDGDENVEPIVKLLPWKGIREPSRRDIVNLNIALRLGKGRRSALKLRILPKPLQDDDVTSAQFLFTFDVDMGVVVLRTSLSDMMRYTSEEPEGDEMRGFYESGQMELITSPSNLKGFEDPFYPNPLPWNPIGTCMNSIPLFFLTNKLSDVQIRALYEEIQTMNDIDEDDWGKKVICPVPWKEGQPDAPDGTPEDMWRIYTEVEDCQRPLFFVDQQSGENLQVIITDTDYVYWEPDNKEAPEMLKDVTDPHYRGLIYGRQLGRDVHVIWANLSISNMGIEEYFDEGGEGEDQCKRFARADWPCHDKVDEYGYWIVTDNSVDDTEKENEGLDKNN